MKEENKVYEGRKSECGIRPIERKVINRRERESSDGESYRGSKGRSQVGACAMTHF